MTRPMIRIHDVSSDEIVDREMTVSEFNVYKAEQAAVMVAQAEAEAKAASREALLNRLGITAEEAALLLG